MKRNKISGYETGVASKAEIMAAKCLDEFKQAIIVRDETAKKWGFIDDLEGFGQADDF